MRGLSKLCRWEYALGAIVLITLGAGVAWADGGPEHQVWVDRPIPMGISGSNTNDFAPMGSGKVRMCCGGTLGALVKDSGGTFYILSNNHVLGASGTALPGEPAVQPARLDACFVDDGSNDVADFVEYIPFDYEAPDNLVDSAIAEIRTGMVDTSGTILDIGTVSGDTLSAYVGLAVKKSGRTTGFTQGTVSAVDVDVSIAYETCDGTDTGTATFTDQFRIIPAEFSDSGDSGSLIVEDVANNPRAVGLLFAGSVSTTTANRIQNVLSAPWGVGTLSMVGQTGPPCVTNEDCDDDDLCTTDVCTDGVCYNTLMDCDDDDVCTDDYCVDGVCYNDAIPDCGGGAYVECITYTPSGQRDKDLDIAIYVVDDAAAPVIGADVTISLVWAGGSGIGTTATDEFGNATFTLSRASDTCYHTNVTSVVATGLTWDGLEPDNGFEKGVDAAPDADCRAANDDCGESAGASVVLGPASADAVVLRRVPAPVSFERASAIKSLNSKRLFAIADVVGHGISMDANGAPIIEVYLAKENPNARTHIPAALEGVAVRVLVTGPFTAR